jgi:hypothetical protein
LNDIIPPGVFNFSQNGLRFHGDTIDVFMKTFEEIAEKLLSVLLTVTHEARGESLNLIFEG